MPLMCIHADGKDVLHVWYKHKPQPSGSTVAVTPPINAASKQQQGSTSTGRSRRTKAATTDDVPDGAMDLAKGLITELMPRYSNGAFMSQKDEKHRDKVSKWYDAVLRIIQARCSASGYQVDVSAMKTKLSM